MLTTKRHLQSGFTIVELLIVVVVIAILAAITIVSYNGISQRSKESLIKSELHGAGSKIALYKAEHNRFPNALSVAGFSESLDDGTTLEYIYSSTNFCLTGRLTSNTATVFHINNDGTVKTGECALASTAEACFAHDASPSQPTMRRITDYYTHESNNIANPACPREVIIPSTLGGAGVHSVGTYAFDAKGLTAVTLPYSMKIIDHYAFQNNALTEINIPSSITTLGLSSFRGNQLTSLIIPSSITSLTANVFRANQLTSITIPRSVTAIALGTFTQNSLTTVSLPTGISLQSSSFDVGVTINYY